MMDFNNAEPQTFDLIPANTLCKVNMMIKPGGAGQEGVLTQSKTSDCQMLDVEFCVLVGPYAGRRIFQYMVVSGGKLDSNGNSKGGNITRSTLRAIIESARGINPKDMGEQAMKARQLGSYQDFNGMEFAVKVGIQKDKTGEFQDKNTIKLVITPDKKEYQAIMTGQEVNPPAQQPKAAPQAQTQAWAQTPQAEQNNQAWAQPPAHTQAPPQQQQQNNVPGWAQ